MKNFGRRLAWFFRVFKHCGFVWGLTIFRQWLEGKWEIDWSEPEALKVSLDTED